MQNIHIFINIIGQVLFGGYFFWNGIKHIKDHKSYTMYAQAFGVPFASVMVYVSGLLIFIGGLGVMFNIQKTISLILILAFLVPVTYKMHQFWKKENPAEKNSELIAFLKNIALIGAVLLLM